MNILSATRVATIALGLAGGYPVVAIAGNTSTVQDTRAIILAERDRQNQDRQTGDTSAKKPPTVSPATRSNPRSRGQQDRQARPNRNQPRIGDRNRGRGDQANDRRSYNPVVRNNTRRNDRPDWRKDQGRKWNAPVPRSQARYQQYRRNYNAPRRYRVERYRWDRGYSYRRYSYGQRLPGIYYGRSFWLTSFLIYGLFAPPPGLIWVRYGPDALLIDRDTGEIIQVRYNVFYS